MPDTNDKTKYEPLGDYLAALAPTTNNISLSFADIERIIGDELPPSATDHREWWANQERGSRAPHWRAAGFKVESVDRRQLIVRFRRLEPVQETPAALTLQEVMTAVNARSRERDFGSLPEWRKKNKGKKQLPTTPFMARVDPKRDWVFHVGGLSELQFNLGFEDVKGRRRFRHGVAFSLQTTRELPNIEPLIPKIQRFNEFLRIYPDAFAGFEMWNRSAKNGRSDNYAVVPIPDSQVHPGSFIFIGRLQSPGAIVVGPILDDFDRLLPLYEFVEGASDFPALAPEREKKGFVWAPGNKARVTRTSFERFAQSVEKSLRHNAIQDALYEHLNALKDGVVSGEQGTANRTYIDVAEKEGDEYVYYEIKTGMSAQSCIREALGQLLEYSYWPDAQEAKRLVIVGEPKLDNEAAKYLQTLKKKFSLPIEYRQFDMRTRILI